MLFISKFANIIKGRISTKNGSNLRGVVYSEIAALEKEKCMKLELFLDESKFEEWLKIAVYSNYADGEKEENIIISEDFRHEMRVCFENSQSLPKEFQLSFGLPILLAFRSDAGQIVGTASLRRDEHKVSACQVNTVAILPEYRRQGLGKQMMREIEVFVFSHSKFKFITLTTSSSQKFYERIGMRLCGVLDFGTSKRYYFAKKIRDD